jgi:hypothetical protein
MDSTRPDSSFACDVESGPKPSGKNKNDIFGAFLRRARINKKEVERLESWGSSHGRSDPGMYAMHRLGPSFPIPRSRHVMDSGHFG